MRQTQLPPDYIELEKRVDALKKVHNTMLQVTYERSATPLLSSVSRAHLTLLPQLPVLQRSI